MIYLGADHAGFSLKEKIKRFLDKKKIEYKDLGAHKLKKNDDYPDHAFKVAKAVAKDKGSRGILFCGTGTGEVIAANKVKGIRAAVAYDDYSAKMSRDHNDTNILGVRSRGFSENKAKKIISLWLKTKFSGAERHKRRLKKIANILECKYKITRVGAKVKIIPIQR